MLVPYPSFCDYLSPCLALPCLALPCLALPCAVLHRIVPRLVRRCCASRCRRSTKTAQLPCRPADALPNPANLPFPSRLSSEALFRVPSLRAVSVPPPLWQGDLGDTFFILKEGRALVTQTSSSGREKKLRHMEEYSCFGERALLTAEPRSANVIAETKVRKEGELPKQGEGRAGEGWKTVKPCCDSFVFFLPFLCFLNILRAGE